MFHLTEHDRGHHYTASQGWKYPIYRNHVVQNTLTSCLRHRSAKGVVCTSQSERRTWNDVTQIFVTVSRKCMYQCDSFSVIVVNGVTHQRTVKHDNQTCLRDTLACLLCDCCPYSLSTELLGVYCCRYYRSQIKNCTVRTIQEDFTFYLGAGEPEIPIFRPPVYGSNGRT